MALVNIRDNVLDQFERYQMPDLEFRVKVQGQYSNSYITNLPAIAKALKTNPQFIVKYYGWNLSTQAKFKKDELQLKGTFDKDQLMKCLRGFINGYLICSKCDLPELDNVCKKKRISTRCRACGDVQERDVGVDRVWKLIHQTEGGGKKPALSKKELRIQKLKEAEEREIRKAEKEQDREFDVLEKALANVDIKDEEDDDEELSWGADDDFLSPEAVQKTQG